MVRIVIIEKTIPEAGELAGIETTKETKLKTEKINQAPDMDGLIFHRDQNQGVCPSDKSRHRAVMSIISFANSVSKQ